MITTVTDVPTDTRPDEAATGHRPAGRGQAIPDG